MSSLWLNDWSCGVVLDTGPLLDALCIHLLDVLSLSTADRNRRAEQWGLQPALATIRSQQRFLNLLASVPNKRTSVYVLAEISRLCRQKIHGPDLGLFWHSTFRLVREWSLEEIPVRLVDVRESEDLVADIGLVDASLIDLSKRNDCILLTNDDRTLFPRALQQRIDCRLVIGLGL